MCASQPKTPSPVPVDRVDEYEDLVALLLDNRSGSHEDAEHVARWVAASCLMDGHLWRAMELADRKELSGLIAGYFSPLFDKNTTDMKWKKFFYRQLCEREGFYTCKSPNCGVCVDYQKCFGAEE